MKSVIIFALCLAVTQGYSVRGRVPPLTAVQAGGRIFYGEDAVNGQFPHMVYVSVGCGGGLISDKWVLSAAHCFKYPYDLPITASLGDVNLPLSPVIVKVVMYYVHPLYALSREYEADISLLELEKSLTFTGNIQPIRIPSSRDELFEGELAILSGFGRDEDFEPSSTLKYIYRTVLTQANCRKLLFPGRPSDHLLCTMGPSDIQTPCNGDSGSPLIVKRPEGDLLIGILNFGVGGGCSANAPTGNVKPHFYLDWIRNTTGLDV